MPTLHSLLGPHTVRQIAPRYTVKYIGLFALCYTYFKYTCTVYCFFPLTWTLFVFCLHFKHLSFILRFSGQSFDKYIYMWYTKTVHVSERCSQLLFVVFLHKTVSLLAGVILRRSLIRTTRLSDVPRWFECCHLNHAENLLRYRDDRVAIYGLGEHVCSHSL